jgi:hypothetical protein
LTGLSGDRAAVAALLGRVPGGDFDVVVRRADGQPVVIANDPLLRDGTPMPTRFWLVDPELRSRVGRLEAGGGVREAEAAVDPDALEASHRRCSKPTGGVGGTRRGVKCLHAHLAWWLAGGDDPVGAWVAARLGVSRGGAKADR